MIDNKNSRLKVDKARPKIEAALKHEPTPYRNPQRPELKDCRNEAVERNRYGSGVFKSLPAKPDISLLKAPATARL